MRRMKRSRRKAEILVTVTAAVLLGAVLLLTGCAAQLDVSALICGAAEDAIARMKKGEA